jgi:hypothetical protein
LIAGINKHIRNSGIGLHRQLAVLFALFSELQSQGKPKHIIPYAPTNSFSKLIVFSSEKEVMELDRSRKNDHTNGAIDVQIGRKTSTHVSELTPN